MDENSVDSGANTGRKSPTMVIIILAIIILIAGFIWLYANQQIDDESPDNTPAPEVNTNPSTPETGIDIIRIDRAIKEYYFKEGHYPESLSDLSPQYINAPNFYIGEDGEEEYTYAVTNNGLGYEICDMEPDCVISATPPER